jgi:hypothetical protein
MKPGRLNLLEDSVDNLTAGSAAAAGETPDDSTLRAKARAALDAGTLPNRRPDRMWGGPGAGARCTICGAAVTHDELELEMEFTPEAGSDSGKHHIHIRCFSALEAEMRARKPDGDLN